MKYVVIVTSILLGLFWVVAPALMKDKVVGLITFASTGRQCFNYYKNEKDFFKDPDSAYTLNGQVFGFFRKQLEFQCH